jgi:hypothetical protein
VGTTISAAQWLNLAINVALPAVVALITARMASSGLKAVVLLALSAVSGFLTAALDAVTNTASFDWSQAGFTVLSGFAVAVLTHFGLLKPLGVTGSAGAIQTSVPGGVGAAGRHEARRR